MASDDNMISSNELQQLSSDVRERFEAALDEAKNAVSLFDFGVAKGLVSGLEKDGKIDRSISDRMYKRLWSELPDSVREAIHEAVPPEHTSSLGRGITVPAALSTRRTRVHGSGGGAA